MHLNDIMYRKRRKLVSDPPKTVREAFEAWRQFVKTGSDASIPPETLEAIQLAQYHAWIDCISKSVPVTPVENGKAQVTLSYVDYPPKTDKM
jgi:hypothetical protein